MDALPLDVVALICAHGARAGDVAPGERLRACCRALHAVDDEAFFRTAAVEQWGAAFWARAFARRTWRVPAPMRVELRQIAALQRALRAHGYAEYTRADFYKLWEAEAAMFRRAQRQSRLSSSTA